MPKIEKISKIMLGMAMPRQKFNDRLRGFLIGAFGEFMKRQVALAIQDPGRAGDWSIETRNLLRKVKCLMSDEVKVTFKDKEKVLGIAFSEAESPLEVTQAKNTLSDYVPEKWEQILKMKFDSKEEFKKMIEEFLPEYSALLKQESPK